MSKKKTGSAKDPAPYQTTLPPKYTKRIEQVLPVPLDFRQKLSKIEFMALTLARGASLNRWEAAGLRDTCLNSTVPKIQKKFGVCVHRMDEKVPTFAGRCAAAKRYWLDEQSRTRVANQLAAAMFKRGLFDSLASACWFVAGRR